MLEKGIQKSDIDRRKLFITSKVWNDHRGYEKAKEAFEKTLKDLQLDDLDLYLIHWPANDWQYGHAKEVNRSTWQALIDFYKESKIRAIGVSNFKSHHLEQLMDMGIQPMVNQIETHPGLVYEKTIRYCQDHNILVEAWSPLGSGRVLQNSTLCDLGKKYDKSVAQICLRYILQKGICVLPKSTHEDRMIENSDIFDFSLADHDVKIIDKIGGIGGNGLDPEQVDF